MGRDRNESNKYYETGAKYERNKHCISMDFDSAITYLTAKGKKKVKKSTNQ